MSRSDAVAPPAADPRAQIKEFLTSRRARVTPEMVGLPVVGTSRRVPGLRREEVALLAGVSVDYYTRLERGSLAGASAEVLEALAFALLLDDAEREHLLDLARAVSLTGRPRRRPRAGRRSAIRPGTHWILEAMEVPAIVRDALGRCQAANTMARALYAPLFVDPIPEIADAAPSLTRFMFLDPRAHDFFPHWDTGAEDSVAMLRLASGADPTDPALTALVGELSPRSRDFARLWARHDVRYICRGAKVIHHPVVGEMTLAYEPAAMASSLGLTLVSYAAEPASPSEEALRLLSSWAATELAAPAEQGRGVGAQPGPALLDGGDARQRLLRPGGGGRPLDLLGEVDVDALDVASHLRCQDVAVEGEQVDHGAVEHVGAGALGAALLILLQGADLRAQRRRDAALALQPEGPHEVGPLGGVALGGAGLGLGLSGLDEISGGEHGVAHAAQ